MQLVAELGPDEVADAVLVERAERLDVLDPIRDVAVVLAADSGQGAEEVLRALVGRRVAGAGPVLERVVLVQPDNGRLVDVGLLELGLEVEEDGGRRLRRAGPDDAETREGEGQEDELGGQVDVRLGLAVDVGLRRQRGAKKADGPPRRRPSWRQTR